MVPCIGRGAATTPRFEPAVDLTPRGAVRSIVTRVRQPSDRVLKVPEAAAVVAAASSITWPRPANRTGSPLRSMHACLLWMDRDSHLVIVIAISVRYGHRAASSACRTLRPCSLQPLGIQTSLGRAIGFDC